MRWEQVARAARRRRTWRLLLEEPEVDRPWWRATAWHRDREFALIEGADPDDIAGPLARRLPWPSLRLLDRDDRDEG